MCEKESPASASRAPTSGCSRALAAQRRSLAPSAGVRSARESLQTATRWCGRNLRVNPKESSV
eukprot:2048387-Pyramimonas_sp.AAC.1